MNKTTRTAMIAALAALLGFGCGKKAEAPACR